VTKPAIGPLPLRSLRTPSLCSGCCRRISAGSETLAYRSGFLAQGTSEPPRSKAGRDHVYFLDGITITTIRVRMLKNSPRMPQPSGLRPFIAAMTALTMAAMMLPIATTMAWISPGFPETYLSGIGQLYLGIGKPLWLGGSYLVGAAGWKAMTRSRLGGLGRASCPGQVFGLPLSPARKGA
jgi:hypothetical protein